MILYPKRKLITFFILFTIFFLSSCGLFSSDDVLKCNDLVLTDEGGFIVEINGDPSDQWTIKNPTNDESDQNIDVFPAFPNPVSINGSTTLIFTVHNNMRVKIQKEDPSGKKDIIFNRMITAGRHSIHTNFENSEEGCFRFDFFFDDSASSNAFGLVLVE